MFVGLFILMTAIKNSSLIIRDNHRIVQQESKYRWDKTTRRFKMRGKVVFDNLIYQYLKSDLYHEVCVEYLRTKVDVWFSAIISIEELFFVESHRLDFKTTKEKLQKYKDDKLTSNRIEFQKALNALMNTNLFIRVKNKDKNIENFIKTYDALIIKYMENARESKQRLDKCLAKCVRLQMLFQMIGCFVKTSKKGSFDDAPNIELKLSKIFLILKNAKKTFLSKNTTTKA